MSTVCPIGHYLNSSITMKELKFIILKFPEKDIIRPDDFTGDFEKLLNKINTNSTQSLQKRRKFF